MNRHLSVFEHDDIDLTKSDCKVYRYLPTTDSYFEARTCHAFTKCSNKVRRCCHISFWIKRRHLPSSLGLPIRFFHDAEPLDKLEYRSIAVRGSACGEMGAPELGHEIALISNMI
jgi:hypothetical protein